MCSRSDGAKVEVIEDNERVRIVRYTLDPGARTGWHRHELDYVIVPYDDCRVRVDRSDGPVEAEMKRDAPYFRAKGTEHDVISLMDRSFSFLEIELK
ncbi:MAG: cupin [Hyphomicrobiaceae bacterium]